MALKKLSFFGIIKGFLYKSMNILNTILGIPTALAQIAGTKEIASETENQLTSLVTFVIGQIPLWITAFIVIVLSLVEQINLMFR